MKKSQARSALTRYRLATLFAAIFVVAIVMAIYRHVRARSVFTLEHAVTQTRQSTDPRDFRHEVSAVARWGASRDATRMLIPLLRNPDGHVRRNAQKAIDALYYSATDTLFESLADAELGGWVAVELGKRTPQVFPELRTVLLNSTDANERRNAAFVFLQSAVNGTITRESVSFLEIVIRSDPSAEVRQMCAETFGHAGDAARNSVPELITVVNSDNDITVVFFAARSLGKIDNTQYAHVADRLNDLLSSPDSQDRWMAANGISWFTVHAKSALPPLRAVALDSNEDVAKAAQNAIASITQPTE